MVRPPESPLSRFVEICFYAKGHIATPREQIAPTGSTVAGIVLGPPILQAPLGGSTCTAVNGFVIGPHDRPIVNEPTGETYCLGVVATPVGASAVFGLAPATLRGRVVELGDGWPSGVPLRTAVAALSDPDEMLDLVESVLLDGLDLHVRGVERCAEAVAALEADPTRSVAALAHDLGISHAHLDREFARVVGLTPRVLSRILRMRRLLESIDPSRPVRWTEEAERWGWFDQAHLIRDFKRHTGVTPSQYVAAQRTYGDGDAAPGFVPDLASDPG